jgi:hypothetical protein
MEVQNASSAWLSDFEVFQVLQQSKETRNSGIKLPENILTVEFEVNNQNSEELQGNISYFFIGFRVLYQNFVSCKLSVV